jgi:hypothetical protein
MQIEDISPLIKFAQSVSKMTFVKQQSLVKRIVFHIARTSAANGSLKPLFTQLAAASTDPVSSRMIEPKPHTPSLERLASDFALKKPSQGRVHLFASEFIGFLCIPWLQGRRSTQRSSRTLSLWYSDTPRRVE